MFIHLCIIYCVDTELNEATDRGERIISLLRSFVVEVNNKYVYIQSSSPPPELCPNQPNDETMNKLI